MSKEDCGYDLASISRFIETVLTNIPTDDPTLAEHKRSIREQQGYPDLQVSDEMILIAKALNHAIWDPKKFRKNLGLDKKLTKKDLRKTIHTPDFSIVMAAQNEELTRNQAIKELSGGSDDDTAARKYYDSVKQNAKKTLDFLKSISDQFGKTDVTIMHDSGHISPQDKAASIAANKELKYTQKVKEIQLILNISYREAQQFIRKLKS